ncbi:response regulator [Paenibacillus sp. GCM10027627]|uniref:response regulator n=1 Tax=unclassified Paenibacillus TaxID=185978 RepID=UPI00363A0699
MKVMIVDDERLALAHLERVLQSVMETELAPGGLDITAFQSAEEALDQLDRVKPEAVFLDIHMPEISGLQAANLIQEKYPDTEIVFVTAYDEYAVNAFELNAMDYLLKPYTAERVAKTVRRIGERRRHLAAVDKSDLSQDEQRICGFGTIRFQRGGGSLDIPKWRTAKAQELFAYLLHRRGEVVLKSTIMEMLAPGLESKRAMTQLYTVIYQVRQCIRQSGMEITIHNAGIQEGYILQLGNVKFDAEQWESDLLTWGRRYPEGAAELERVLELYEGDYFQDCDYIWAEQERERLRQLWLQHGRKLAARYLEQNRLGQALRMYERIHRMDPYHEEEGVILLQLYDQLGHSDKVASHYGQLRHIFEKELGLSIPAETEKWYWSWRGTDVGRK